MKPDLHVVADAPIAPKAETVARRVQRLQDEARALAKDHIKALGHAMLDLAEMAAEIAEGGDVYPPGIRDVARRLVAEMEERELTVAAIAARSR